MKKMVLLCIILLSSCASFQTITSLPETASTINEYPYYDYESKIRYQVTNDEKNLHIKLITSEETSIIKIFRTGLTIYFDVNGKKKKDVYFQYPIARKDQMSKSNMQRQGSGQQFGLDLERLLTHIPLEAVFSHSGSTEQIHVLLKDPDIYVSIEAINDTEIIYDVIISFDKISQEGFYALSDLSVGIVSGKFEMLSMGTGMSGDRGGQSGGMGGKSGNMGGRMSGAMDMSSMSEAIDFWFKVELHEAE